MFWRATAKLLSQSKLLIVFEVQEWSFHRHLDDVDVINVDMRILWVNGYHPGGEGSLVKNSAAVSLIEVTEQGRSTCKHTLRTSQTRQKL